MNFVEILPKIIAGFDSHNLSYALIGGLAMAMRGIQRTTLDVDFILLAENLDKRKQFCSATVISGFSVR